MRRGLPLLPVGLFALAGCATLGGNVKGSFSCSAPGGSCAPTATIDDRALAMIVGTGAGPVSSASPGPQSRPAAAGDPPARVAERVLRIVLPAWIDSDGRLHETSAVRAVVETGRWQTIAAMATGTTVAANGNGNALAAAIERADPPGGIAPDPQPPNPDAVAAARARIDPVASIRADVARRLAGTPAPASSHPAVSITPSVPVSSSAKDGRPSAGPTVHAPNFPATTEAPR